ncbi:MAG: hypothetical protein B7Y56_03485 [Gallionellales bacterium 35-53-114]|jgi:hypothetical protein|nr:MAG: hypothetical protein B7Y56_03485 [Gallionellales bacterium 35-53-114]OYZ65168.1 MAG: hypothetical protein B7Y04_00645 [Gallionellales bacterium 24-53-125]OZB08075.1 MAG: hypothetical protein B7X61_11095 [Gallionellales bacterium 39-52-133]HQS59980.1 hypothetical protein [Gallionellaceae bacterium]HQS76638.1 hypothetical protein [Gallionellaceae bacterium]
MKRPIIQFATCLHHGKENEVHPVVHAYQCRNGLAVGHTVKEDEDGHFKYQSGWEIYHVATGAIVSPGDIFGDKIRHATPAAAMRNLKNKTKGKLLGKLKLRNDPPALNLEGLPEIIGKLKPWPKPAASSGKMPPGCDRIASGKNTALLALIAEIDAAIATATRTSKLQKTFTIGRSRFTVGARLESLQRFRANVLKNRRAFADNVIQPAPAAPAIQAAPQIEAAPTATAPAKPRQPHKHKPSTAPQPARDIWFYLTKKSTRASATA